MLLKETVRLVSVLDCMAPRTEPDVIGASWHVLELVGTAYWRFGFAIPGT